MRSHVSARVPLFATPRHPRRADAADCWRGDQGAGEAAAADVLVRLRNLPAPAGATALLPPLAEALSLAASRGEKRKRALLFTDGRTAERTEELRTALAALDVLATAAN